MAIADWFRHDELFGNVRLLYISNCNEPCEEIMTALNDLSHKEWMDLVQHPNTKRADGSYAYRVGAFLDDNPHPLGSENYYLWKEGWESGLEQDNSGRSRLDRLKVAILRRDLHGWLPEQKTHG